MADLDDALRRRVDDLPVLPGVLMQLLALDPSDDDYFEDVRALVESDPAFAARVLAAANAAASAPRDPVTAVDAAIARLGSSGTADILTALSFATVFVPRDPWEKSLWRHSVQVAVGTRAVVAADPDRKIAPGTAYTAGLIHDIGRFVMFHIAADELRAVDEGDWDTPAALVDAERAICGLTHTELGSIACRNWGLPEDVTTLVDQHHDPFEPNSDPPPPLLEALRFADLALFPSARPDSPSWVDAPREEFEAHVLAHAPRHLAGDEAALRTLLAGVEEHAADLCAGLGLD